MLCTSPRACLILLSMVSDTQHLRSHWLPDNSHWLPTHHVTYQQASQGHHCQARHLLQFLLAPPYPIQASDERKTHGIQIQMQAISESTVTSSSSGWGIPGHPCTQVCRHPHRVFGHRMPTADAGGCRCTPHKMPPKTAPRKAKQQRGKEWRAPNVHHWLYYFLAIWLWTE